MKKVTKRKWHRYFFLKYAILINRNLLTDKCPECHTPLSLERLPMKGLKQKLRKIIGIRYYHCKECKQDKYYFSYKLTPNLQPVLKNYLIALLFFIIVYYLTETIIDIVYQVISND
ncbi:MAG: hypothetical protein ACP5P3_04210 [Ignavibacteria bacterium]